MSIDDFVNDFVQITIERKKQQGISPVCCTLTEILRALNDEVLKVMRKLHQDEQYIGSLNKDKVPMLIDKNEE